MAGDILEYADFFVADDKLTYDEAAFDKRIRKPADAAGLLKKLREQLGAVEPFDAPRIEKTLNDFVQAQGIKIADIIHALRVAVTGKSVGFGVFESVAILGKHDPFAVYTDTHGWDARFTSEVLKSLHSRLRRNTTS